VRGSRSGATRPAARPPEKFRWNASDHSNPWVYRPERTSHHRLCRPPRVDPRLSGHPDIKKVWLALFPHLQSRTGLKAAWNTLPLLRGEICPPGLAASFLADHWCQQFIRQHALSVTDTGRLVPSAPECKLKFVAARPKPPTNSTMASKLCYLPGALPFWNRRTRVNTNRLGRYGTV
jgi:hypothetical protein